MRDRRPLHARSWLLRRIRLENRIARVLCRVSGWFVRDAQRLIDEAVSSYKGGRQR